MKWLVNGAEHEFGSSSPAIRVEGELVWVRTNEGWKSAAVHRRGNRISISFRGRQFVLEPVRAKSGGGSETSSGEVRAPMPGLLVSIAVKNGDLVRKGDVLMVIEAMKTQISITSPVDGNVEFSAIEALQPVKSNQVLAIVNQVAKH